MSERTILFVSADNATVEDIVQRKENAMFDHLPEGLMELAVAERGRPAGHALPAFPLCCSIVLCCSSSSSKATNT